MEVSGMSGMQVGSIPPDFSEMRSKVQGIIQKAAGSAGVDLEVSDMGKHLSELQALKNESPELFEELMTSISEKLAAAAEETDGKEAEMLSRLSEKFSSVAISGDLSQLAPPKPPPMMGYGTAEQSNQVQALLDALENEEDLVNLFGSGEEE